MKRAEKNFHTEQPLSSPYPKRMNIVDDAVHGPYKYFGTVRALGLSADADILQSFLNSYLNNRLCGSGINVDLDDTYGAMVFMVVSEFPHITGHPYRGNFRNRSVQFHVPVILKEVSCGSGDQKGREFQEFHKGTVQVFSYASNMWNALTSTEYRGPLTRHAKFRMDTWIEDLQLNADPCTCFSAAPQIIGDEGEVLNTKVLSVQHRKEPLKPLPESIKHEKTGSASSPWSLKNLDRVFAIKQFQHQTFPEKVCYESLVEINFDNTGLAQKLLWRVGEKSPDDGRDRDDYLAKTCVRIRRDEAHPIVEALGLKPNDTEVYNAPEQNLAAIERSQNLKDNEGVGVCDDLFAPLFYQVMTAAAPEVTDTNPDAQQLTTDLPLQGDLNLPGTPIIEDNAKTLCYRYRTDIENNGWLRR